VPAVSCTDERGFVCFNSALASFKANPLTSETKYTIGAKTEKRPSHRIHKSVRVGTKAKPATTAADAEPPATSTPFQSPSLTTQLDQKSSAPASSGATEPDIADSRPTVLKAARDSAEPVAGAPPNNPKAKSEAAADLGEIGQPTAVLSPNSKSRTMQEQVAAAIGVAERMTVADLVAARDDVEPIKGEAPNNTDLRVAVVMTRPEVKSVTDLAGKSVAMDERYSASSVDVWVGFVVAGKVSVEVSAGHTAAIDRLSNGEVTAAVLALVSADAADGFPEIAGFKIFRVPLWPSALKARP
jgi:hypothetical protein